MTARPLDPASRRRPLRIAVALVLVMVAVLTAGCNDEGVVQTQDIEIVKIQNNGTLAWSKTIDYGNDEEMRDIIETDDGNFIIAGGSAPRKCTQYGHRDPPWYVPDPRTSQLIGLSIAGEILWLQNYSFNGDGGMISVFENPDHTLDAVTKNGELWHLNSDGSVIMNRSINITSIDSVVKTRDGGYVIVSGKYVNETPGSNISRIVSDGSIIWSPWFDESRFKWISPIIEIPNKGGYLFSATIYNQSILRSHIIIARLNPDGKFLDITPIADVKITDDYNIQPSYGGYVLRYSGEMQGTTLVKISEDGQIIEKQTLPDLSSIFIPTKDGGYLSVDFQSAISSNAETRTAIITKTDKDGKLQWKNNEIKHDVALMEKKAIETSDGAYVVMFASKKMSQFC